MSELSKRILASVLGILKSFDKEADRTRDARAKGTIWDLEMMIERKTSELGLDPVKPNVISSESTADKSSLTTKKKSAHFDPFGRKLALLKLASRGKISLAEAFQQAGGDKRNRRPGSTASSKLAEVIFRQRQISSGRIKLSDLPESERKFSRRLSQEDDLVSLFGVSEGLLEAFSFNAERLRSKDFKRKMAPSSDAAQPLADQKESTEEIEGPTPVHGSRTLLTTLPPATREDVRGRLPGLNHQQFLVFRAAFSLKKITLGSVYVAQRAGDWDAFAVKPEAVRELIESGWPRFEFVLNVRSDTKLMNEEEKALRHSIHSRYGGQAALRGLIKEIAKYDFRPGDFNPMLFIKSRSGRVFKSDAEDQVDSAMRTGHYVLTTGPRGRSRL